MNKTLTEPKSAQPSIRKLDLSLSSASKSLSDINEEKSYPDFHNR